MGQLNPLDYCVGLTRDRAVVQWRGLVVPVGNVVATLIVKQQHQSWFLEVRLSVKRTTSLKCEDKSQLPTYAPAGLSVQWQQQATQ